MENIMNTAPNVNTATTAADTTDLLERLMNAATFDDMLQIAVEGEESIAAEAAVALAEERFSNCKRKLAEYLLGCATSGKIDSYEIELDTVLNRMWTKSSNEDNWTAHDINFVFADNDVAQHVIQRTCYEKKVNELMEKFGFEIKNGYFYKKIGAAQILRI